VAIKAVKGLKLQSVSLRDWFDDSSNLAPHWLLHNHEDICIHSRKHHLSSTRIILVSFLAACATLPAGWGHRTPRYKPRTAGLLAQLRSDDAEARSEAFDHLRSDPAALPDSKVKAAVVSLLDRENQETLSGKEEDYAE
jgi:hypothetical protein